MCKFGIQGYNEGKQTGFYATAKTEVGAKLVRLKAFRNWELKQAVVLASALGEEKIV